MHHMLTAILSLFQSSLMLPPLMHLLLLKAVLQVQVGQLLDFYNDRNACILLSLDDMADALVSFRNEQLLFNN